MTTLLCPGVRAAAMSGRLFLRGVVLEKCVVHSSLYAVWECLPPQVRVASRRGSVLTPRKDAGGLGCLLGLPSLDNMTTWVALPRFQQRVVAHRDNLA